MTSFSSHYYDTSSTFHGFIPNIMGTRLDLIIIDFPREQSNLVWNNIVIELKRLHKMLNRFDPTSELSRINIKAKSNAVSVSSEMWSILENCKHYYFFTDKLFDITLNNLSKVFFDEKTKSIAFPSNNFSFDLGGYAKGYAIERIKKMLLDVNVKHALVNFGDSSIAAIGHHPFGDCWSVSIENPFRKGEVLKEIELRNEDLSTSGNAPSHKYHIFNPATKEFNEQQKVVCVKSKNSIDAEVLTTTLMIATIKQKEKIESNFTIEETIIFNL